MEGARIPINGAKSQPVEVLGIDDRFPYRKAARSVTIEHVRSYARCHLLFYSIIVDNSSWNKGMLPLLFRKILLVKNAFASV